MDKRRGTDEAGPAMTSHPPRQDPMEIDNLPELRRMVHAERARAGQLATALQYYGRHDNPCPAYDAQGPCNCGFAKAFDFAALSDSSAESTPSTELNGPSTCNECGKFGWHLRTCSHSHLATPTTEPKCTCGHECVSSVERNNGGVCVHSAWCAVYRAPPSQATEPAKFRDGSKHVDCDCIACLPETY